MSDKQNNKSAESSKTEQGKPSPPRRFRRRIGDNEAGSSSMWLISFTDVMALMLTFFVLLFAMSNPKQEEWKNFTQQIQANFNRFQGALDNRGAEDAINIEKINFSQALNLNYLRALIENLISKEPSLGSARLIDNGDSLIISLPQNILFDVGQADIKSEANKALYTLAGTLRRIKNRIEIVGHTDPRPIAGNQFPSNWELSLTRAASVAAVLENVGYDKPITVRGQASGRFYDIPKSVSVEERLDLSRRVDIVVMEDDGRRQKLFDIGLPELP
jgi:chemotaxis protein MotB